MSQNKFNIFNFKDPSIRTLHFPLVLMLLLTELSVGLYGFSIFVGVRLSLYLCLAGFVSMAIGLAASTSHLGRPLGAWRSFLGLRRSWLSREIFSIGLLGVFISIMIYHDTRRDFWAFPITALKFFGTTLGLATAVYWALPADGCFTAGLCGLCGLCERDDFYRDRIPGGGDSLRFRIAGTLTFLSCGGRT